MAEHIQPVLPKELNLKYEDAIRSKLAALMRSRNYSQNQLAAILKDRGLDLGQGNLSLILSGARHFPLSLIVHLCDIFDISLPDLVDENFGGARQSGSSPTGQVFSSDLVQLVPYLGEAFVTDPSRPEFQGYLQTYYVYLKPTLTFVNKLQSGTLTLEARGPVCEATLRLNCDEKVDGEYVCKVYQGRAMISTSVDAVYVLLTSPIEGDLSLISFRHSHRPHQPLNCRIAAVLTNESGEFHSPTLLRMFLSRVPIAAEHHPLLIPHLYLNEREIAIKAENLAQLRQQQEEYGPLIDLMTQFQPISTYYWNEDYVMGLGRFFLSGEALYTFLTRLRGISQSPYQNKTSHAADLQIRNLLLTLGYYGD